MVFQGSVVERKPEIGRTIRSGLASGCFGAKSRMFPSTIHSVMTHKEDSSGKTPSTGKTFGWERCLQITIYWSKRYEEPSGTRYT